MTFEEQLSRLKEAKKEYEFSQEVEDAIARLRERKLMPVTDYNTYDDRVLYCPIFKSTLDNSDAPKDSLLHLLFLLKAKPKEIDLEKEPVQFSGENDSNIYVFNFKDKFLESAIDQMLEFINLSSYLLSYQRRKNQNKVSDLLSILVVLAANEYEQLFSSRGKNEFAYYLIEMLTNCDATDFYSVSIKPYDTDKWRNTFRRMTNEVKTSIRNIIASGQDMKHVELSNIVIALGTKPNPYEKEKNYFIEIGISQEEPSQEYNHIIITPLSSL